MLAKVRAFVLQGIDAVPCEVEVDHAENAESDKPTIVGLPDTGVKECVERIRAALFNCGYGWPRGRLVINLAPADLKKEGNALELPIALGILHVNGAFKRTGAGLDRHKKFLVAGELALDGAVRPIKGALSMAMLAKQLDGIEGVILPADNAPEAAVVPGVKVFGVTSVSEMVGFLNGELDLQPHISDEASIDPATASAGLDFSEVRGQELAKRALTIAAAGRHNLLLLGPPGAGKTEDKDVIARPRSYRFGRGVDVDQRIAFQLLLRAAKQGLPDAQFSVGLCHSRGEGVPADPREAERWYSEAAKQGDKDAKHNLKVLKRKQKALEGQVSEKLMDSIFGRQRKKRRK